MHFISFVKLFHFSLGIFHLFFIPLPRIFFISFLVPFHFFAWDIFHSLPGTFSFHCLGYFSLRFFIPLPGIFSFICQQYFHSPA
jgi:hypothetical protein